MDIEFGTIDILVDDLTSCLKDGKTGDIKETVVFKIETKKFLDNYNEKNGWYIDWKKIPKEVEVYALALKEDNSIQGLVGVKDDKDANAVYIHWAVVAPHNNKQLIDEPKFIGVGGHLFAIAIDKSYDWNHNGVVYGFASNEKVLKHYIEKLSATYLGLLHKYQFAIMEDEAKKIKEVYDYEWN